MYIDAIKDITDTREAARTPTRDGAGVSLQFRYYNLLYYVERRFFPYGKRLRGCDRGISGFRFPFEAIDSIY